jgi:flagellar biosynthesis/type III secretory pathway M-ring protein FliF/YscJ
LGLPFLYFVAACFAIFLGLLLLLITIALIVRISRRRRQYKKHPIQEESGVDSTRNEILEKKGGETIKEVEERELKLARDVTATELAGGGVTIMGADH